MTIKLVKKCKQITVALCNQLSSVSLGIWVWRLRALLRRVIEIVPHATQIDVETAGKIEQASFHLRYLYQHI